MTLPSSLGVESADTLAALTLHVKAAAVGSIKTNNSQAVLPKRPQHQPHLAQQDATKGSSTNEKLSTMNPYLHLIQREKKPIRGVSKQLPGLIRPKMGRGRGAKLAMDSFVPNALLPTGMIHVNVISVSLNVAMRPVWV